MVSVLVGQTNTTVNLGTQARNPDFSSMPVTKPVSVGTSLPSTCVVGQLFFNSSAAAGTNLYECSSANTWTSIGGGSNLSLPVSVANGGTGTSTPGLIAGSNVTITGTWPNQTISGSGGSSVAIGSSLPASCTVGALFFNTAAASGSNLYGCTAANIWTVLGGATLTSPLSVANGGTGTATPSLVAGSNVSVSGTWPNQTIADTSISIGTSAPATCSIGQLFFNRSSAAGSNLYGCTAANVWTLLGGATLTLPLAVANGGTGTATPALVAGSNVTLSGTWPNQTINSSNPLTIGTSTPSTCTVGQLLYNTTAASGSNFLGCTAANTWTVVGGATLTSPLPIANGGTGTATPALVAGTNVTLSGSWPNQTINSSNPVVIGTTNPTTCTVGQLFYNTTAASGSNFLSCTAANTWTSVGGTSSGSSTSGNATSIQGASVATTAPANNQMLVYNSTSASYTPTTIYTLQNGLGTTTSGTSVLQVNVSMGVRAVTATTDTIANTDCGGLVTYNNASAVAVALPQAGLAGNFAAGCPVTVRNYGAGTVTVTPATSTIGGATSQAVSQNKGCLIVSDGTNWQLGNCN